jgi:hypothetical protein
MPRLRSRMLDRRVEPPRRGTSCCGQAGRAGCSATAPRRSREARHSRGSDRPLRAPDDLAPRQPIPALVRNQRRTTRCPCGGHRSATAFVVDERLVRTLLTTLGLAAEPASFAPARAPPRSSSPGAIHIAHPVTTSRRHGPVRLSDSIVAHPTLHPHASSLRGCALPQAGLSPHRRTALVFSGLAGVYRQRSGIASRP